MLDFGRLGTGAVVDRIATTVDNAISFGRERMYDYGGARVRARLSGDTFFRPSALVYSTSNPPECVEEILP